MLFKNNVDNINIIINTISNIILIKIFIFIIFDNKTSDIILLNIIINNKDKETRYIFLKT